MGVKKYRETKGDIWVKRGRETDRGKQMKGGRWG